MDIGSVTVQNAYKMQASLQVAVLNKAAMQQEKAALMKLMQTTNIQRAASPHLGGNIDIKL